MPLLVLGLTYSIHFHQNVLHQSQTYSLWFFRRDVLRLHMLFLGFIHKFLNFLPANNSVVNIYWIYTSFTQISIHLFPQCGRVLILRILIFLIFPSILNIFRENFLSFYSAKRFLFLLVSAQCGGILF